MTEKIASFIDFTDEIIFTFQQQILTHRNENIIVDN
jgi:hypothetical protein